MNPFRLVFDSGFFDNGPVHTALIVGSGAALVSAVLGVFTIIRGQSFAGHALADISSTGGSAALLFGINPLLGFMVMALAAATGMEIMPTRRVSSRERDLITGVVLGAGMGLSALFLYLDATRTSNSGAAVTVMFGSMFSLSPTSIPLAAGLGAIALIVVASIYRPLLLSCVNGDLAAAMGINVRLTGLIHCLTVSLAVSLAALTVGAVLATALLIGPAATALRMSSRPGRAILLAAGIALLSTWGGILLAYNSYYWTPGHGWPVSFFIVLLILLCHLLALLCSPSGRPARTERWRQPAGG